VLLSRVVDEDIEVTEFVNDLADGLLAESSAKTQRAVRASAM
jgi:hypothetical protein